MSERQFTIIEAPDMDKLARNVALSVKHGWKPIGDVSKKVGHLSGRLAFVQGMTKNCDDLTSDTLKTT